MRVDADELDGGQVSRVVHLGGLGVAWRGMASMALWLGIDQYYQVEQVGRIVSSSHQCFRDNNGIVPKELSS